jgi:hypothetical protein
MSAEAPSFPQTGGVIAALQAAASAAPLVAPAIEDAITLLRQYGTLSRSLEKSLGEARRARSLAEERTAQAEQSAAETQRALTQAVSERDALRAQQERWEALPEVRAAKLAAARQRQAQAQAEVARLESLEAEAEKTP